MEHFPYASSWSSTGGTELNKTLFPSPPQVVRYLGQNDNRKEGWVGWSPAPQDVTWAIREQVGHVGFVQKKALCWSEFLANSRGDFWLLQHKVRGVRLFKWLLETSGDQNSLRKLEAKSVPETRGARIIRIISSNHPSSFHHPTLRHGYQREIVLFTEPLFGAYLFPRETRSSYKHFIRTAFPLNPWGLWKISSFQVS